MCVKWHIEHKFKPSVVLAFHNLKHASKVACLIYFKKGCLLGMQTAMQASKSTDQNTVSQLLHMTASVHVKFLHLSKSMWAKCYIYCIVYKASYFYSIYSSRKRRWKKTWRDQACSRAKARVRAGRRRGWGGGRRCGGLGRTGAAPHRGPRPCTPRTGPPRAARAMATIRLFCSSGEDVSKVAAI